MRQLEFEHTVGAGGADSALGAPGVILRDTVTGKRFCVEASESEAQDLAGAACYSPSGDREGPEPHRVMLARAKEFPFDDLLWERWSPDPSWDVAKVSDDWDRG